MAAGEQDDTRPLVPCVGGIVHDRAHRLLVVRRGQEPSRGLWSVPGGRVEPGETLAAAVEREVLEETGLRVRAGAEVGRVRIDGGAAVYDVADLACVLLDDAAPVAGDDATEALFVDAATLTGLDCTPGLVKTLAGWGVLPD
ncbi:NUDIX domain-containing protein [Blastococcus sp. TF02A_35]|uniref:NUDIX domain-containing protein n=1 Tax=Blastococcus sp. TF02A-35 TaxID=2559612 RepID=UPI001073ED72|nr:NUDIX domain-containing protein [Blastococcus sp. TF02A_35]TFV52306.1 NUDIX domain-containing protein [Blastococcus sp. TF02A_35]